MTAYLVTGATGRVGAHVLSGLAEAGHRVRALVRDTSALPPGVDAVAGDLSSPDAVAAALDGVDAVYLMWPGIPVQAAVIDLVATRARRVVYLSTDVTDLDDGETPTSFHQDIERRIRASPAEWTFVRAIDFAANALAWAGQVRTGVVSWPYAKAARSLVHERDIAEVAVTALTTDGHHGGKYVVTGPEAVTHERQAAIIGEAIGRDVRFDEVPPDVDVFAERWGDRAFARARLAAWKSFTTTPERVTGTVEHVLGRPARDFRSWADDHTGDFA
ncbi:MAG TPA: NmrA family NAD(P)-binding protein [Phytomonospora sp.]